MPLILVDYVYVFMPRTCTNKYFIYGRFSGPDKTGLLDLVRLPYQVYPSRGHLMPLQRVMRLHLCCIPAVAHLVLFLTFKRRVHPLRLNGPLRWAWAPALETWAVSRSYMTRYNMLPSPPRRFFPTWARLGSWQLVLWVTYEQLRARAGA